MTINVKTNLQILSYLARIIHKFESGVAKKVCVPARSYVIASDRRERGDLRVEIASSRSIGTRNDKNLSSTSLLTLYSYLQTTFPELSIEAQIIRASSLYTRKNRQSKFVNNSRDSPCITKKPPLSSGEAAQASDLSGGMAALVAHIAGF